MIFGKLKVYFSVTLINELRNFIKALEINIQIYYNNSIGALQASYCRIMLKRGAFILWGMYGDV